MKEALGLIETKGLAAAIHIADTMLKVAAVELFGIEEARGNGWMTVKVTGNVGAVKAAVDSGTAAAKESQVFVSAKVIPRAAEGLGDLFLEDNDEKKTQDAVVKETKAKTTKKEASKPKPKATKKETVKSKPKPAKKEASKPKPKAAKKETSKAKPKKATKKSSEIKAKVAKKESGKPKTKDSKKTNSKTTTTKK